MGGSGDLIVRCSVLYPWRVGNAGLFSEPDHCGQSFRFACIGTAGNTESRLGLCMSLYDHPTVLSRVQQGLLGSPLTVWTLADPLKKVTLCLPTRWERLLKPLQTPEPPCGTCVGEAPECSECRKTYWYISHFCSHPQAEGYVLECLQPLQALLSDMRVSMGKSSPPVANVGRCTDMY